MQVQTIVLILGGLQHGVIAGLTLQTVGVITDLTLRTASTDIIIKDTVPDRRETITLPGMAQILADSILLKTDSTRLKADSILLVAAVHPNPLDPSYGRLVITHHQIVGRLEVVVGRI